MSDDETISAEQRQSLRTAADEVAIQKLVARYAMAVDAKRWEELDDVFAPGAVVDFTANGGLRATYPDVVAYLRDAMGVFAASQHYMMNFDVTVEGDRARGRFYCFTQMVTIEDNADKVLSDGGFYDAEFTRSAHGWQIRELVGGLVWLEGDWPEGVERPAWYGVSTARYPVVAGSDTNRTGEARNRPGRTALRGAWVVDGTGTDRQRATVVVEGDRISAISADDGDQGADEVVDLDGLILAPGFIDPHTHYDAQVLWDPDLTPSSWHGVTTVVMGNCGFGVAPTHPEHRSTVLETLENVEGMSLAALQAGLPFVFETFPQYMAAVEASPVRLNVGFLFGHTPLRTWVMGDDATERIATEDEVAEMRRLVAEALDAGALGFSTSRSESHRGAKGKPVPSRAASLDEVFALADVLREKGRGLVQATWGPDLFVDEFARLASTTGRPVSWAALMTLRNDPDYARRVAERVEERDGQVYPQIACRPIVAQLTLADPAPLANVPAFGEVLMAPRPERRRLYEDPAWRERAARELEERWRGRLGDATVQETSVHTDLRNGPTLAEIGRTTGLGPLQTMVDLALEEELETRFRVVMINDDDDQIQRLLQLDRFLLGLSDAGAHATQLCDANYTTYLLSHWVRDRRALSLEKAVWRLSGHPASVFGITDRGRIAPGMAADLVAFDADRVAAGDLERVRDFPGGSDRLIARSRGVHRVWVNGTAIVRDGQLVDGARPGRLVRST